MQEKQEPFVTSVRSDGLCQTGRNRLSVQPRTVGKLIRIWSVIIIDGEIGQPDRSRPGRSVQREHVSSLG
jgi:hypothetical protein